jgi:hypothetical protein
MTRALRIVGLTLAVFTVVAVVYTAHAENPALDFTLVNKTGYTIEGLYISPTASEEWGEDVLGQDTLENGQKCKISFHHAETAQFWDLKVTWSDESEPDVWHKVDLTKFHTITIYYDRAKDKTWAEGE